MPKHSSIFLFSKTSHPDVNHIPILSSYYLQPKIDFTDYDYVIASSKETLSALDKIGDWKHLPVLAISQATAAFAEAKGAKLLDVAQGSGKDIIDMIQTKYPKLKALYPHATIVAVDIETQLKERGIDIDAFSVYETRCSHLTAVDLPEDAICIFTSPSAVKCFLKQYLFLPTYKIVCIGETTRDSLPQGITAIVSEKTSLESTVACAKSLL